MEPTFENAKTGRVSVRIPVPLAERFAVAAELDGKTPRYALEAYCAAIAASKSAASISADGANPEPQRTRYGKG